MSTQPRNKPNREALTPGRDRKSALMLGVAVVLWTVAMVMGVGRVAPPESVGAAVEYRIDVNTAGVSELQLLPNVGRAIAQRIVEEREAHGPFTSLQDMQRVKGIGPVLSQRFRDYVRFDEP